MTLHGTASDNAARFEAAARVFGERFKEKRDAQGLSIEQVVEKTGLPPSFIATIEGGSADPTLEAMVALADAVGVEVWDLLGSS